MTLSVAMSDDDDSAARALVDLDGSSSKSKRPDTEAPTKASASKEPPKKRRKTTEDKEHVFPVQPNTIQVIKKPRTYVNHSYRDFSNVPPEDGYQYTIPKNINEMTFSQKIFDLLSSNNEYAKQAIEWCSHGRAFRIVSPAFIENSGLLKTYFDHNRYTKFLRQLANHAFKRLTEGRDSGCYYSEVIPTPRKACFLNCVRSHSFFISVFSVHASWAPTPVEVLTGARRTKKDSPRPRTRARLL
jgi:HSF-type DNA-binding